MGKGLSSLALETLLAQSMIISLQLAPCVLHAQKHTQNQQNHFNLTIQTLNVVSTANNSNSTRNLMPCKRAVPSMAQRPKDRVNDVNSWLSFIIFVSVATYCMHLAVYMCLYVYTCVYVYLYVTQVC